MRRARLLRSVPDARVAPPPVRATPSEAVSWGKVDPEKLPDTIVCYCDSTIALPLLSAYALANHAPRKPKRLYEQRDRLFDNLVKEYRAAHVFGPDGGVKPRA